MARISDINSVIVPAESPVFSAHTYTEIYGGTAGCTIVMNGITVQIAPSTNLTIRVRSASGGTGCYLLGENMDVYHGGEGYS